MFAYIYSFNTLYSSYTFGYLTWLNSSDICWKL